MNGQYYASLLRDVESERTERYSLTTRLVLKAYGFTEIY